MTSRIKLGDLEVNRLGFGAMRVLGSPDIWGPPKDPAHARKLLRRAYELGANFFDTAESYGPHTDETVIAEAMHPYPKDLVIGTKCGLVRPRPSRWDEDARPEKLKKDLEGSLKRLKLDRIDLWQLHAPDPKVPIEDSLGAMADAQRAGKVRHIGVSNFDVKQLERARRWSPWSRCRTSTTWRTAAPRTCSSAARSSASPSCPGIRSAPGQRFELPRGHTGAGRDRVAARALAGHAAHSGHQLHRASGGKPRRGADRALPRGLRGARPIALG